MTAGPLAPWSGRLVGLDDVDGPLVVGCSGGADSLALLSLVCGAGLDAVAVHVDHGLRPASAHDADVVEAAARRLGVETVRTRVEVAPGPNLEARAREVRYAALDEARREHGARAVAVGHTLDDQAETVLLNLLRGSGAAGLAGMAPVSGTLRRPLLRLRRSETREICARLGFAPVEDPMNGDPRHRRVWLRREVIPLLEAGAHRDLTEVLARQADVLRVETDYLDLLAAEALGAAGDPPEAAHLAALPAALARRAVRAWLGAPPPPAAQVEAVLAVARGDRRGTQLVGGRKVERSGGHLHLIDPSGTAAPESAPGSAGGARAASGGLGGEVPMTLPGAASLGPLQVEAWVETVPPAAWPDGRSVCVLDADAVGEQGLLRPTRPGDRFQPLGLAGTKSAFDVLADHGVAASRRMEAAVLTAGPGGSLPVGDVVWLVGYRVAHRARVTTRTKRFLWVSAATTGPLARRPARHPV